MLVERKRPSSPIDARRPADKRSTQKKLRIEKKDKPVTFIAMKELEAPGVAGRSAG